MDMVKISCPYCGLSKVIPRDKAPTKPVKANCPKCRHQFPIHPDKLQSVDPGDSGQVAAASTVSAPPPPPPRHATDPHAGIGGRPESIGNLFTQSFGLFVSRFPVLFGLYLLILVMVLISGGLFGAGTFFLLPVVPGLTWLVLPLGGLITTIVATYFLFWGYAAFVHAVIDQECGFGEALRRGREQVWSFMWAISLSSFLVVGAYFLFVVPGVLFSVWFLFVPFIIALEPERGMNSLLKSYQYVRGNWWNTFFKLFVLTLVCGAVGAIPLVGWVLSLLATPFMLVFIFTMYYDLQQIKGTRPVNAASGRKTKWVVVGSLGYLVLPAVIIAMTGGAFITSLMTAIQETPIEINLDQGQPSAPRQRHAADSTVSTGKVQPAPPPQKVLQSNATLSVTKDHVRPGGTVFINFHGIEEPAEKDWIAFYRVGDPNEQYGEWDYLNARASGTVNFTAPAQPGVYEARLYLDWPTGGYHDVARTGHIVVGDGTVSPDQSAEPQPGSPLDRFRPKNGTSTTPASATSYSASVADPGKLYVYVFSLNYKGDVRLNGEPFYEIRGEEDMSYNYTGSGSLLKFGNNTFDVVYDAVPGDPWMTKIQVKVYAYDADSGRETVIADWESDAKSGKTQLSLALSPK